MEFEPDEIVHVKSLRKARVLRGIVAYQEQGGDVVLECLMAVPITGIKRIPRAEEAIRCSFCGKARHEVARMIAGLEVYICGECVGTCNEILADDAEAKAKE